MKSLKQQFDQQHFPNAYALVDGVEMNAANPDTFLVPHPVLKKHVGVGHFVELRIDSPRVSVHQDAAVKCYCPSCNGEATKPILGHHHPASLVPLPKQNVPSRGWGEDFWVKVTERDGQWFQGVVDNPLVEARLHELRQGDAVYFHQDHILAVHGIHRKEIVLGMDGHDLKTLAQWLGEQRG
ncbi:MAG: hypothetical protein KY475_00450 [Planctomycetes bacterium]|nr:hypothetical protein [Planctomycetota bacterium]